MEVEDEILQSVLLTNSLVDEKGLYCSYDLKDIENCNYYILTVPKHEDKNKRPDFILIQKPHSNCQGCDSSSQFPHGPLVIKKATTPIFGDGSLYKN